MTYFLLSKIFVFLLALAVEGYIYKFPWLASLIDKINMREAVKKYFELLKKNILKKPIFQGVLGVLVVILLTPVLLGIIFMIIALVFGKLGYGLCILLLMFVCFSFRYTEKDEDNYLVTIHERSFGMIFWFILLSWVGALAYWLLIALKKDSNVIAKKGGDFEKAIIKAHGLAAWLPARITGIIYAFAGHFKDGIKPWLESITSPSMPSSQVLLNCGKASYDAKAQDKEEALAKRALIIWCCVGIVISFFA